MRNPHIHGATGSHSWPDTVKNPAAAAATPALMASPRTTHFEDVPRATPRVREHTEGAQTVFAARTTPARARSTPPAAGHRPRGLNVRNRPIASLDSS